MKSKNNRGKLTMLLLPYSHGKAAKIARKAAKKAADHAPAAGYIINAHNRICNEETVIDVQTGLNVYASNPKSAAILLADAILRNDRKVGQPIRHNGKRVGLCYKHKQPLPPVPAALQPPARSVRVFALFPLRQNGKRAKNPLFVAKTQGEAEFRKKQFDRFCPYGVEIVPQTKK